MSVQSQSVKLANGSIAWIVDLGGIVHVLVEDDFPAEFYKYSRRHKEAVSKFRLESRDAVGIVWFSREDDTININPVVWVRAIDTLFYESSCGSGSIAVAYITGGSLVVQPSGQVIEVSISDKAISLASEMEIVSTAV